MNILSTLNRILFNLPDLKPNSAQVKRDWVKSDHAAVILKLNHVATTRSKSNGTIRIFLNENILNNQETKEELQCEFHTMCEQANNTQDDHTKPEFAKMALGTVALQ